MLREMIKEEWRMHSKMFGSFMFALFPVLIVLFSFAGSIMLPMLKEAFTDLNASFLAQAGFFLFGLSIGSFGLMGREFMNRRFGHASLIAYSSRTLPVSEKQIFANFLVKDVIYYMVLWTLPFVAGYGLSLPLLGADPMLALLLFAAVSVWFIFGMSISFLLSTAYANSRKLFMILVLAAAASAVYLNIGIAALSELSLFPSFNMAEAGIILFSSLVMSAVSLLFMRVDYPEVKKHFSDSLGKISRIIPSSSSDLMAKDLLDLNRSEGGAGKIIFSFLAPLAMIWVAMAVLTKMMPQANTLPVFAVFIGTISSTIYNWLTEFDLFTSYSFLPVKVSDVIASKIKSYALLNLIPVIILIAFALFFGQAYALPQSLLCMISVSAYSLAVLIFLSGLYPNIMLYSAKTFTQYLLMNTPVLLLLIFSSIFLPELLFASPLLLLAAVFLLRKSFKKWDTWEHPNF